MSTISYGLLSAVSIGEALGRIRYLFEPGWTVIVRSIDSARERAKLARILAYHGIPFELTYGNICLSIHSLEKALSEEAVFTGFDEVWIIPGAPPSFDLGRSPSATSDGPDLEFKLKAGLLDAMKQTHCIAIFGDGLGLNYVIKSPVLEDVIRNGRGGAGSDEINAINAIPCA